MLRKRNWHCLVHLEVARYATHVHEGDDVACEREVLEDNNDVTSGSATGIETAALLEHRPESRDESPEV